MQADPGLNVCRVCMSTSGLISLIEVDGEYMEIFQRVTGIDISGDKLNAMICGKCVKDLNSIQFFRWKANFINEKYVQQVRDDNPALLNPAGTPADGEGSSRVFLPEPSTNIEASGNANSKIQLEIPNASKSKSLENISEQSESSFQPATVDLNNSDSDSDVPLMILFQRSKKLKTRQVKKEPSGSSFSKSESGKKNVKYFKKEDESGIHDARRNQVGGKVEAFAKLKKNPAHVGNTEGCDDNETEDHGLSEKNDVDLDRLWKEILDEDSD